MKVRLARGTTETTGTTNNKKNNDHDDDDDKQFELLFSLAQRTSIFSFFLLFLLSNKPENFL